MSTFNDIQNALQDFVADVRAADPGKVKEEWPDLYVSYCRACAALGYGNPESSNEDEDEED